MNTKVNNNNSSAPLRDSNGRFVSKSNRLQKQSANKSTKMSVSANRLKRESNGRFAAKSNSVSSNSSTAKSSFIKKLAVNGPIVEVVLTRYPKITYNYKPSASGMRILAKAMAQGTSLGTVYNQHLRGHEVSRTIYK